MLLTNSGLHWPALLQLLIRSELQEEVSQQHLRSQSFRRSLQRQWLRSIYLSTAVVLFVLLALMALIVSALLFDMSTVGSQQIAALASRIRPASLIIN